MIFQPHAYQREAVQRLLEHPNYGLFLDMGLGKTVVTLTAINILIHELFDVRRVLIIAPRTVAETSSTPSKPIWKMREKSAWMTQTSI